ncbi:CHAT domain-containing protein [Azotobacter chroococcum]|uniref:CHAT domain-containing protein n=1 Tax=Azotobacter chroococcum TaxID=353 RepID=UPI0012FD1C49|nr:CHAT domain-containing protein [Azotobacter chroococcum]
MPPEETFQAGLQYKAAGEFKQAFDQFAEAADAFGQHEDAHGTSLALAHAADCCRMLEDFDNARALAEAAVQIAESISSPELICHARMIQGQVYEDQGDRRRAASILKETAELAERHIEDPLVRCNAFLCYGDVLYMLGKALEAKRWLEKAACIARDELTDFETQASHHRAKCNSFVSFGEVLLFLNDEQGIEWLKEAAGLTQHTFCDPHTKCIIFKSYGEALRVLGRRLEARQWLNEAKRIADDQPLDLETRCQANLAYGQILGDLKQLEMAAELFGTAVQLAEELDDDHYRCLTLHRFGDALRSRGALQEAEMQLSKAATLAGRIPDKHTGSAALRSYAELLISLNRLDEARLQLRKAQRLSKGVPEPLLHCNLHASLMHISAKQELWEEAWQEAKCAQEFALKTVGSNRSMRGIAHFLSVYHPILDVALTSAEEIWRRDKTFSHEKLPPLDLIKIIDASKCVAIREGLRRHLAASDTTTPGKTVAWRPAPQPWQSAFKQRSLPVEKGARQRLRGPVQAGEEQSSVEFINPLELPSGVTEKNRYCATIDEDGLRRVIDANLLLLHFVFHGNDLLVAPLCRDSAGIVRIVNACSSNFPFYRAKDVRKQVQELVLKQRDLIYKIGNEFEDASVPSAIDAAYLSQSGHDLSVIYEVISEIIGLPAILGGLKEKIGSLDPWHLVVIPDGPLYQFPLHALRVGEGDRVLYEKFASVHYAVSLRMLDLLGAISPRSFSQQQHEPENIKGVVFANPDKGLNYAFDEVRELVEATSPNQWWVHGDADQAEYQATRFNFEQRHAAGNLLWLIGHGNDQCKDVIEGVTVFEPAFILKDGPLGISRLLHSTPDFTGVELLMISACWLGKVDSDRGFSREIESYHALLSLHGCRRVTTALWPLADIVAPKFARCFIRTLGEYAFRSTAPQSNSFACAHKHALNAFRTQDGGRFDHEFFWAPYTLYGLG